VGTLSDLRTALAERLEKLLMANWTLQRIMDMVQELAGEPAGAYYNLSSRLKVLNSAQQEMFRLVRGRVEAQNEENLEGEVHFNLRGKSLNGGQRGQRTQRFRDALCGQIAN